MNIGCACVYIAGCVQKWLQHVVGMGNPLHYFPTRERAGWGGGGPENEERRCMQEMKNGSVERTGKTCLRNLKKQKRQSTTHNTCITHSSNTDRQLDPSRSACRSPLPPIGSLVLGTFVPLSVRHLIPPVHQLPRYLPPAARSAAHTVLAGTVHLHTPPPPRELVTVVVRGSLAPCSGRSVPMRTRYWGNFVPRGGSSVPRALPWSVGPLAVRFPPPTHTPPPHTTTPPPVRICSLRPCAPRLCGDIDPTRIPCSLRSCTPPQWCFKTDVRSGPVGRCTTRPLVVHVRALYGHGHPQSGQKN